MTNNSTGYSPFYALYGRHPDRPLEIILNKDKNSFSDLKESTMIQSLQLYKKLGKL